jgi:WD40 repeat protein
MRADFYGRLAEHPELRSLVASQQVLLGPLDARGLRRAIEQPPARAGLELEPGLTRRVLTDVADRPGTLPLMEHLLLEVWQRRRGRTLTLEAYAASGGVEGALARRANSIYGSMSPERQAVARRVLLRLTQPGEGTEDTRRRATRRELITRPGEEDEVHAVIASLAEARLLTTGTDEATGDPVVDVTHEALIRGWPELRGWINDDREQLRLHRRLSDAAADWDAGGRDEGQLYRGAPLAVWEERDESDLNELERGFLSSSRERVERERATRRRRTRITIGALAGVAAVIAGIAVFAFVQRGEATSQRDVARSRQLAGSALLQLPTDPELSLLLAERAYETDDTPEAEEVLRQATFDSRVRAASHDHTADVNAVAYTARGENVASADDVGDLQIWNPRTGDTRSVATGQASVTDVAIAADGRIATAGDNGTIRLWATDGRALSTLRGHEGVVDAVAFASRRRALASAGDDGTVRLWNLSTGRSKVIGQHEGGALAVAVSPDGGRIASGGADALVRVWTSGGAPVSILEGHEDVVNEVAFSPDGRRLISVGGDSTARIWTLAGRAKPAVFRASQVGGVYSAAYSEDGRHLVTAADDGTVRVWTGAAQAVTTLRGHEGAVYDAVFDPSGRRVASAGADDSVRVWDWAHTLPTAETIDPDAFPYSGGATFAPDGRSVFSIDLAGSLSTWDTSGSSLVQRIAGEVPEGFVTAGGVSPDGSRFAIARPDGVIEVRPTSGAGRRTLLRGHEPGVLGLAFSADGGHLASAGNDGSLRVWDLRSGSARVLREGGGFLFAADLSADGARAAAIGEEGIVYVYDVATGDQLAELRGHDGAGEAVDLSPDGRRVVSGGADRSVRVWDVQTGEATVLRGHASGVVTAAFGADGTRVISAADDGVRVWDWAQGTTVLEIPAPALDAFRAALSADGTRIAVTTFDGRIRAYPCETCGSIDAVLDLAQERVTRELSQGEREAFSVEGSS